MQHRDYIEAWLLDDWVARIGLENTNILIRRYFQHTDGLIMMTAPYQFAGQAHVVGPPKNEVQGESGTKFLSFLEKMHEVEQAKHREPSNGQK